MEVEGLQLIECTVVESAAEVLYDVIQGSLASPDLSASMGTPLPKSQMLAATVMVASPMAQEPKAITPKPTGGASVSREEIPTKIELLRINVGNTRWVYHCHMEGCTEGPSTSWAAICFHVYQAHLGTKLSCALCFQAFFNTDAL